MLHRNRLSGIAGLALGAATLGAAACAGETAQQEQGSTTEAEAQQASGQDTGGMQGMGQAPHGEVSQVTYQCAEGGTFTLTIAPGVGKAALRLEDGTIHQLDQAEVASGMEFSDGTYTFRGKGMEGFVEKDGERLLNDCVASGHPR